MKPADAHTEANRMTLESDNFPQDSGVWSILLAADTYVSLHAPNGGEWVEIPRDQFRAIAEWYLADQPTLAEIED